MQIDIEQVIHTLKKPLLTLWNFFIFSIINVLYTSTFFMWNSGHEVLQIIFGCITISLLVGYIVETAHLHISNNCEKLELPAWNINIIKYIKYSLSLVLVLTMFNLTLYVVSVIPIQLLSGILQLLAVFLLSFIVPCCIIIYAKNLKLKETLNFKIYYHLIKNHFKKFIIIYIPTTIFFLILMWLSSLLNSPLIGLKMAPRIPFYISNYIAFIGYFIIILLYSQLFKVDKSQNADS